MNLGSRLALLLPLLACSCAPSTSSPESVGNTFMDRYYIERDHAAALPLVVGAAAERVESERKLAAEGGGGLSGQPRVFYKLRKVEPRPGGSTQLSYRLTVDSEGAKLQKDVTLVVRKEDQAYKVASFGEKDAVGP